MASTIYDETIPLGSDDAGELEDFIKDKAKNFRERLQQGGKRFSDFDNDVSTAQDQYDGRSCIGWENQASRDDEGYHTLVWDHSGANPRMRLNGSDHVTEPDLLLVAGDVGPLESETISFRGVSFGTHTRIAISDPFPIVGYLKQIVFKASDAAGSPDRNITKIKLVCGTKPSSASLILDLRKRTVAQQTASNDPFTDGTTTSLSATTTLTVASGNFTVENTLGAPITLTPGEELIIKWSSAGAAADVTVLIQVV